ncbi:MAG: hypothetical protein GXO77_10150 [Calditrichaeota bacterium]|nr:hypothetical protein [Calditrichota bacterium]
MLDLLIRIAVSSIVIAGLFYLLYRSSKSVIDMFSGNAGCCHGGSGGGCPDCETDGPDADEKEHCKSHIEE